MLKRKFSIMNKNRVNQKDFALLALTAPSSLQHKEFPIEADDISEIWVQCYLWKESRFNVTSEFNGRDPEVWRSLNEFYLSPEELAFTESNTSPLMQALNNTGNFVLVYEAEGGCKIINRNAYEIIAERPNDQGRSLLTIKQRTGHRLLEIDAAEGMEDILRKGYPSGRSLLEDIRRKFPKSAEEMERNFDVPGATAPRVSSPACQP